MDFMKLSILFFMMIGTLYIFYFNDDIDYNKIYNQIENYKKTHIIKDNTKKGGILMSKERPVILGHRGYRAKFPENTILAYKKAIEFGADGVELDVQLSKDGALIIHHDDNFEKITGNTTKINDLTSKEIKKIKINGENIPTLEEVFIKLPEYAYINVEIKDVKATEMAYNTVKSFNALDRVLFSSFNIEALRILRKLDENVDLGLLIEKKEMIEKIIPLHEELNFYSINLPVEGIEMLGLEKYKTLISKLMEIGLHIVLWTLNDIETLKKLEGYFDGIITDNVETIVNYYINN
ncbi:glycerophosphodiester phosphodiesterase family protein [Marinitoga sp. 1197]|uniref:glycerophosphodiester phosphodiesterase family protein n=1 Tax=Marinitoga sp. 1197 TaxID=1428449 RepID=UPI000A4BEF48|nr:glycerophosphodiester phosphodiesterase family protein [Marinitoga sp. 1197]